ncbi:MAG: hypothetical protein HN919_14535 [Verrucomicrobia bacterium]|jgi:hypothetical protein|nr:hypothetical protein [Verrucomicrobiota bacterium]MBT7067516.1 hypothetical protein [Verrucomicrobiota bacterium]MBT7700826.1 hypothetical protein [Verrucomicrobiota bacterium]
MNRQFIHSILISGLIVGTSFGLEKETSLVTGKNIGNLAVAGKLLVDMHADFMMNRSFEKDAVLQWYNMGLSGGGKHSIEVGGSFGDFGLHVPHTERDKVYPHAVKIGNVQAAQFDGGDIMKGNFVIEAPAMGDEDLAIEVWVQDKQPKQGEVICGWQSADGKQTSGALTYPKPFKGSDKIQLITVNCTAETETWYVNGKQVASSDRKLRIAEGHKMVLGGASALKPSFNGNLVALRLHTDAMTEEEIAHNATGGVMLGTDLHDWWRMEGDAEWRTDRSKHFKNSISRKGRLADMDERQLKEYEERLPGMFEMAENLYQLYSERLALRSSVVSNKREYRGDGVKYTIPNQPSNGSWMGWSGKLGFGWSCSGAGHINPHELVHGWQAQSGGAMQGNYWEAHANFPQTYAGIYQTIPGTCVSRVCMFFPANGRDYYHDRLMFQHLAEEPEYGPMFISKFWYDGGTGNEDDQNYPWLTFPLIDPDPSTDLGYEWMRMVQKCITWDYQIHGDKPADHYKREGAWDKPDMTRYGQVLLEQIPYDTDWWRAPKEMSPQQLGYSVCPLKIDGGTAMALLDGYISKKRGGDWRAAFVGVKPNGDPVYGDVVKTGGTVTLKTAGLDKLYLIVCAVPTKIMAINMTGDFRSLEQEKFPYKLQLSGCTPIDVLANKRPTSGGKAHANGGGFVADGAEVDDSAYVGPNAQILGNAKVLGNARIEDYAVVNDSTVRDHAIVSGHALVAGNAMVQDHAKVRDWGRAIEGATIKDYGKVIEHGTQAKKVLAGYSTIKGVAHSFGNVSGNSMVDGSYAKGNEVDKGKWFTWSWGKGKNAGEVDEEFGGIYMRMNFDAAHEWMAPDDFGATWGYLVGNPTFDVRVTDGPQPATNGVLVLNGKDQFVELQSDVADMSDLTMVAAVTWQGKGDAAIAEFSNDKGERVFLGTKRGKLVFSISKGDETQSIKGPTLKQGVLTEIMVVLSADSGKLFVDDEEVAGNTEMTLNPDDVNATECYLGRGRGGNYFKGTIDAFEVYSVSLKDEIPPTPNPATLSSKPLFVNPKTVVMQAEVGADPLGGVEYFFAETSGNPGGDDSGWIKEAAYKDTGLEPGKEYVYTVKMRDASGNVGKASAPAKATWTGGEAFQSADGKTIVIEAESYTRRVAGAGAGRGIEWKLQDKPGCSGKGLMAALPDKGTGVDAGYESQCPRLDYLVNFPAKGKYTVWMRSWGANPNGDSIFLGMDLKGSDKSLFHIGNGKLQWQKHHHDHAFDVTEPGMHTIHVWMREDGSAFDKLVITLDRGMITPEGNGPAESRQQ